jgi:replicative DNA helicase
MSNSTSRTPRDQAHQAWLWARPPQALNAEQAVLAACLHSRTALDTLTGALDADDFARPAHQLIWPVLVTLHREGTPVDPVILGHRLRREGLLHRAGGHGYLYELSGTAHSATAVDYYAAIVAEAAWSHRLHQLGKHLIAATAHGTDPAAVHAEALHLLTEATHRNQRTAARLAPGTAEAASVRTAAPLSAVPSPAA